MLHEQEVIESFRAAMREHQIDTDIDLAADGNLHRFHVSGDKPKTLNGWYVLHIDGIKPAGAFGCYKRHGGEKFTWTGKLTKPLSAEERLQWRRRMEAQRVERETAERTRHDKAAVLATKIWESARDCSMHPYLKRKGVKSHGLRFGRWEKVDQDTGEVRLISDKALLIPLRDRKKRIHSLQAILPAPYGGRDKDYLKDGAKSGFFFTIGKPLEEQFAQAVRPVVIICEGYATGASIHEATGHACVVAFDAGNLMAVGRTIRDAFPQAAIVFAADNDQWTLTPLENPGLHYAREAAKAVRARIAVPQFDPAAQGKPTDFNDLAQRAGAQAVKDVIQAVLHPPKPTPVPTPVPQARAPTEAAAAPDPTPPQDPQHEPPPDLEPVAAQPPDVNDYDPDAMPENNRHFSILGYDHGQYFIFNYGKSQISTVTAGSMTETGLIELAPLHWWELHFPGEKSLINTKAAANFLIQTAHQRGIYDSSRIRGRGAWVDEGRAVYHHGGYLSVNGVRTAITMIKSRYVYELDRALPDPAPTPLGSDEGEMILDCAKEFRWTKPGSAALLAGWVALAPLCGALRWRPHIWLTGGAGCGKSTVLNSFAHHLLAGLDLFAQGSSSEAGIRQTLRADARPVLFDESEQNNDRESMRIQGVLALIRQASTESEALTLKGSSMGEAMSFHIRSMFCLASVQVGIRHQADVERLAVLSLRPKHEDSDPSGSWKRISASLSQLRSDSTLPARLFRRSMDLLPKTLRNIEVFIEAASGRFSSVRDGDQYGTLLAGAWSLISTEIATKEQALEMIDSYDWSEHREQADSDDAARAMSMLLESHVRFAGNDVTVYELIVAAKGYHTETGLNIDKADAILQRYGMKIKASRLLLSNTSHELRKLVSGSEFEADLRGVLLRVPGADRNDNKPSSFNGSTTKCISLPLDTILEKAELRNAAPF